MSICRQDGADRNGHIRIVQTDGMTYDFGQTKASNYILQLSSSKHVCSIRINNLAAYACCDREYTSKVSDVAGELTGKALALALEQGYPARGPEGRAAGDVVLEHLVQWLLLSNHLHVLHPHHLHADNVSTPVLSGHHCTNTVGSRTKQPLEQPLKSLHLSSHWACPE